MKLKLALAAASMLVALRLHDRASADVRRLTSSGGYSQIDGDGGADLGAVTARVGVNLTPNFAIEGEGSVGVGGDSGTDLEQRTRRVPLLSASCRSARRSTCSARVGASVENLAGWR